MSTPPEPSVANYTKVPFATATPNLASTIINTVTLLPAITPTATDIDLSQPGLVITLGEDTSGRWSSGIPVFSPDGKVIALANSKIMFWDAKTYQLLTEIQNPYGDYCQVANAKFSPDGIYFAASVTGCQNEKNSGHLLVWETSTGDLVKEWTQEYAKMPGPEDYINDYVIPVYAFAFLPNSTSIVFSSGNTIEVGDLINGEIKDVLKLGGKMYATQISTSSDGRLVYIIMSWQKDLGWPSDWTYKHVFQIWNINTHAMLQEIKYPEGWVNLSLELINTRLVEFDFEKRTAQLLNLETNNAQSLPFRNGWRYFNSDGSLVVYARLFGFDDDKQSIELWKTDTWRNIYTFTPDFGEGWIYSMREIAFSPDDGLLAIQHREQVSLWNIRPIVQP